MDSVSSKYYLLDEAIAGHVTNVPSVDIYPHVTIPLSTSALRRVLQLLLKHNFVCGHLVLAGCVTSLHYSSIIKLKSGCPMIIATGESQTGKTTSLKVAISLTGVFCD